MTEFMTDEQAVEAGILIPIGELGLEFMAQKIDRVSIALWQKLTVGVPRNEDGSLDNSELLQCFMDILARPAAIEVDFRVYSILAKQGLVYLAKNERGRWTLSLSINS